MHNVFLPPLVNPEDAVSQTTLGRMKTTGCRLYLIVCKWLCIKGRAELNGCDFKKCVHDRNQAPYAQDRYIYPIRDFQIEPCFDKTVSEYYSKYTKFHMLSLYDYRKLNRYFKYGLY